jgi:hypothetical protein
VGQAETGMKTSSREKLAETMVPANAVLQAWRTKPTHDGTRVKMPRNTVEDLLTTCYGTRKIVY